MTSHDELVSSGYCFAKPGTVYAIYLPANGTGTIDLTSISGQFSVDWYNPQNGGELQPGSVSSVPGGKVVSFGHAPDRPDKDWVCLLRVES